MAEVIEIGHVLSVCLFPLKFLLDKVAVWFDVRNMVSHYGGVLLPVRTLLAALAMTESPSLLLGR